MIGSEMKKST